MKKLFGGKNFQVSSGSC